MLVDDLEVGVGEDLAGAVVAARTKIEFCVLQCDIRGNDSFQSLDAFGDDFLPDAVTGNYCEFQICHVAIVARGRQVGRRGPYFGVVVGWLGGRGGTPQCQAGRGLVPKPRSRRHWHHLAVSTQIGSIDTTRRHRIAQKPQCPSSKRCQSRQTVSIRSDIARLCREYAARSTPTSVNPPRSHRIAP